jgi:hypothetical protein
MEYDQINDVNHRADAGERKKKVICGIVKEHECRDKSRAEGAKPRYGVRRPDKLMMTEKEDQVQK